MKTKKRHSGFTIVELLIVIVVMGILATLVLSNFSGAQQRARNTVRLSTARAAYDVMRVALIDTPPTVMRDSLNNPDGWYRACVGTGYKDIDADGRGDCGWYNNVPYVSTSENFDTILKTWSSIPSAANYPEIKASNGNVVGGTFVDSAWVDGRDMLALEYVLEGEQQKCVLRPLIYKDGLGNSTLTPSATPEYTISANGTTECMVAVVTEM